MQDSGRVGKDSMTLLHDCGIMITIVGCVALSQRRVWMVELNEGVRTSSSVLVTSGARGSCYKDRRVTRRSGS